MVLAENECVFCRQNKTAKTGSGYEKITKCVTYASADKLLNTALNSSDEVFKSQLIGLSVEQIVAKEFMYHLSCYKQSTKPVRECLAQNPEKEKRTTCFEKTKNFVDNEIIINGSIYRTSEVTAYYRALQEQENIEVVGDSNKNLKLRLQNLYGHQISFMSSAGKDEFIFSEKGQQNLMLLSNSDRHKDKKKVMEAANAIRLEIEEQEPLFNCWPPNPDDVKYGNINIPPLLTTIAENCFRQS